MGEPGFKRQKNSSEARAPPKKRRKKEQCCTTKKKKQNVSIDKAPFNSHGKTKQLAMRRNLTSLAWNPRQANYFENGIHIQPPILQRNYVSNVYNTQPEWCHRNNIVASEADRGIFRTHSNNAGDLWNMSGRAFNKENYANHPAADSHFHPRS